MTTRHYHPRTDPTIEDDLRARWLPSQTQMDAAAAELEGKDERATVYTIHLLVNKHHGWWTRDVQVKPIEGKLYRDRDTAWLDARFAVQVAELALGEDTPVSAGYAVHFTDGHAAVFEA